MLDKTVAQKLMIKEGRSVLFVNPPRNYKSLLGQLPREVKVLHGSREPADIIQVFVNSRSELKFQLGKLKNRLKPDGFLWITYHKGTSKVKTDINRDSIAAYASTLGLRGVAMISVDDDWSALSCRVREQ